MLKYTITIFIFLIFSLFFIQPSIATVYEHSFKITDIKTSEDSDYYFVSIFFKHDYLSPSPYNDDNWDIMIAWAWGPYADSENLLGYDSASAYLTQSCLYRSHPNNIDEARINCN
jgi:hypothetical protein